MRNWLRTKLHNFMFPPQDIGMNESKIAVSATRDGVDMDNSLRFNVLSCQGGVVVQLYKYDQKRDRSDNSTYVIPENEDVTQRIAEIVSMELLKN